jgi:hypothetical protein
METDGEISQLEITDMSIRPNSMVSRRLVLQLIVAEIIVK